MLIRLLTIVLFAVFVTPAPAQADPASVYATFEQNLVHVPTLVVAGELKFTDTADDKVTATGHFTKGFGSEEPTDYKWVLVNSKGDIEYDLTKDVQAVAEILPPEIAEFTVTFPARTKDLLGLDAVVYQVVPVAGIELLAETGRTRVTRT
jgi:hypothetical protein